MIFYKGDIVLPKKDEKGNKLEYLWGANLIGVTVKTETNHHVLFHRPIKTKIKLWLGMSV